jgi:hypothetical protein
MTSCRKAFKNFVVQLSNGRYAYYSLWPRRYGFGDLRLVKVLVYPLLSYPTVSVYPSLDYGYFSSSTTTTAKNNDLRTLLPRTTRPRTLTRPKQLNTIPHHGHWELDAVWQWTDSNPDLSVGIFTSSGHAFCTRADLRGISYQNPITPTLELMFCRVDGTI